MSNILFLNPVFQHRIWGGETLKEWFPNDNVQDKTGECWAISAHPNGLSIVEGTGKNLKELYETEPELFGNPTEETFPLLVKILDAANDLSVQVHPDDAYGLRVEGELGKTECWYILDCEPGATIIFGHTAQTEEEFRQRVESGEWNELLVEVPVHKGDFFYVPSGTVHALKSGTLVLEVQQSSDTTYRLYDYDRLDDNGEKRELHIEKSIEVSTIPHTVEKNERKIEKIEDAAIETLVSNEFFTVKKIELNGKLAYKREADYVLATVSSGTGQIDGIKVQKGTSFIIPNNVESITLDGNMELIISFTE